MGASAGALLLKLYAFIIETQSIYALSMSGYTSDTVSEHIKQRLKTLEQQATTLRAANRDLERRCFDATQRGQQLAQDIGFESLDEAETSVRTDPHLYNRATTECNALRVASLERELQKLREAREADLLVKKETEDALEKLKEENTSLREKLSIQPAPTTDLESSVTIATLRAILSDLQTRYDALVETRNRIAARHRTDIHKWRRFKDWIFEKSNETLVRDLLKDKAEIKAMMPALDDVDTTPVKVEDGERGIETDSETVTADVPQAAPTLPSSAATTPTVVPQTPTKMHPPSIPMPLSRNYVNQHRQAISPYYLAFPLMLCICNIDVRADDDLETFNSSQTQEDSQAPAWYDGPSTSKVPEYIRLGISPPRSPRKGKGKRKRETGAGGKMRLKEEVDECEESLVQAQPSKKQKGKARASDPGSTTINAQFEINPEANEGLAFQFDTVVRSKRDRHRMDAGDCECCRDYYEAIGPLPPRLEAPLWRSPSHSRHHHHPPDPDFEPAAEAISTHKYSKTAGHNVDLAAGTVRNGGVRFVKGQKRAKGKGKGKK
ncbi:hypothetical protein EWM64_g4856 [Hericium alpestre]|uniref:DNA endonuclease activator Ctp1 C-terminal domain-containing protein n=1 Tax=Hericium alpestre TaxID=135208 RepID=A0A4Y9ZX47_9AGAM|nr:hypothetical protein EWM64_g4856 [Hericium alpestre]